MIGRKSNLKILISKLREVGVSVVKTTEFVQGQTSRWGLAWSFVPSVKKIISSHVAAKSVLTFMLEVWNSILPCIRHLCYYLNFIFRCQLLNPEVHCTV